MADQEDEDLQMALRMSMQSSPSSSPPPERKKKKPRELFSSPSGKVEEKVEETEEARSRRVKREILAAAAERRMMAAETSSPADRSKSAEVKAAFPEKGVVRVERKRGGGGGELSEEEANKLYTMVFGGSLSKEILGQWSNQGIRFSPGPETSMGLVQHEGGPCGVLAAIQAFVLKYLLFVTEDLSSLESRKSQGFASRTTFTGESTPPEAFSSLTEETKKRALIKSMGEILFRCGNHKQAVIATLSVLGDKFEGTDGGNMDEIIAKALEDISIESPSDVQKFLRVNSYSSSGSAFLRLQAMIPVFQSRMGAMLFLFSALLSRGLDAVQADRDDPSLPLVTAPFGHASQEIVNLLLCGQAVANVFDERIDLGGGMFLKGISMNVDVGFLTLLESLNFCKVGQHLKSPKWPIWVVGSESHYTVLFALEPSVQDENEMEARESQIRRTFDNQDQSGGGGFISMEGFHQVLRETNIQLPSDKVENLCSTGFIVWSEFWRALLDLDKNLGGMKDSSGLMGKKVFDLYHFNGIAKSVPNGNQCASASDVPVQRPRLTKLKVSVPPRWTPEEYMVDAASTRASGGNGMNESHAGLSVGTEPKPPQHAPLADCIRTRWPRAICNWTGDPPSIV
ncbi:Ubiquitin carboxyl-terminal hydrolase MINDY-3-like protein [Drosera capensis]